MRLLVLLHLLIGSVWTAPSSTTTTTTTIRVLEDQGENLNQYTLQQGICFRVKIAENNDDDGNSYFYNGSYRSQYMRYIGVNLCQDSGCSLYVLLLDDFLESSVEYVNNYCASCQQNCRRFLEDEQEDEQEEYNVDCNECSVCNTINNNKNSGLDESQYLDCQVSGDYDDLPYYTAPQCENGEVVIGHFYDDECTIKTSVLQDKEFSYSVFNTIAELPMDCSISDQTCDNILGNAYYCDNADNDNDDAAKLCKAAKAAGRTYTFYKKPFYKKVPLISMTLLICVIGGLFGFLSYTYYVRHTRKMPLADLDGSHLPNIS